MIAPKDVYHVIEAMVPLYVAMMLAFVSTRWWKLFSPEQCAGINKFVAKYSIPLLSFQVISSTNPYQMNLRIMLADLVQKSVVIFVLVAVTRLTSRGGLKWVITGLSLSTMPNTLILGIPLLKAMYGKGAASVLSEIVFLQSIVWYNLLLFLFELQAMKAASVTPSEASGMRQGESMTLQENVPKEGVDEAKPRCGKKLETPTILIKVGKKLLRNPNTHATLLGLTWACIHFKWGIALPTIIDNSIQILSRGGLGMAMFSLGLFMASQQRILAAGTRMTAAAMVLKFVAGPALMAVSSFTVGLRGNLFRVALVQAALPQGIVPFVFAKEYNVHPEILSTTVIFGMLIAMPISLGYYLLLAL
ncbi:hypothetical protein MLD38_001330 [Melastoma candidum]|uniref:Uncharacterized protein n=1 Tax=Melastoma candidum TaxID=119954 RepID=A0ACB9SEV5_9MYRT|nr:hypothetical protein MLD38_001330 [Melastoma candidum]